MHLKNIAVYGCFILECAEIVDRDAMNKMSS